MLDDVELIHRTSPFHCFLKIHKIKLARMLMKFQKFSQFVTSAPVYLIEGATVDHNHAGGLFSSQNLIRGRRKWR